MHALPDSAHTPSPAAADVTSEAAIYDRLTDAVLAADTLPTLVQPLLRAVQEVSGLESAYLTEIDWENGRQHVQFADNRGALRIDAGLSAPWDDTLCKRALEQGITACDDVPSRWGDSAAGRALGIQTYLTAPIRLVDGQVFGTLCAAGTQPQPVPAAAQRLLRFLALLIAQFIDRDRLARRLAEENARLRRIAHTDALTALPNRRALQHELAARFDAARHTQSVLVVVFIDLDDFKTINDRWGHAVGDAFLQQQGQRLRHSLRPADFLARIGGDEFVVLATLPAGDWRGQAEHIAQRLRAATTGRFDLGAVQLDYAGASVGWAGAAAESLDVQQLLAEADAAMYRDKLSRKPEAAAG